MAVALFHRLVGVHGDDIVADFLLTNTAGDAEARVAQGAKALGRLYGPTLTDSATLALMSVEASYLAAAFDEIEARHGDVGTYLRDVLQVSDARRKALETRLLG